MNADYTNDQRWVTEPPRVVFLAFGIGFYFCPKNSESGEGTKGKAAACGAAGAQLPSGERLAALCM
jgi:hypothetical protein